MKKTALLFILTATFAHSFAQIKVSALPQATGYGQGNFFAIVQNGVSKQMQIDSILYPLKLTTDSLRNIKPLYRDVLANGTTAAWNFDSSSTIKFTTAGPLNLFITGNIPTGSTGVMIITQSASGGDAVSYNGTPLIISKQANRNTLVGFVKLASSYVFSSDTLTLLVQQTGGFDVSSQTLFAAANTSVSYQNAVNNAIVGLKGITLAAGGTAWSKSVMINGRAGSTLTQQSFNWKNPTIYNYVYNGTFVYNANGTIFDATNYLSTGIAPNSLAGTTSDISYVQVFGQAVTTNGASIGSTDLTAGITTGLYFSTHNIGSNINSGQVDYTLDTTKNRFIASYLNNTTLNVYKNGIQGISATVTNNPTFLTSPITEGGFNAGSSIAYKFAARVDVTQIINSKLTASEAAAIDAVWATYQTALNR